MIPGNWLHPMFDFWFTYFIFTFIFIFVLLVNPEFAIHACML